MFVYDKKLQYPIRITNPNPKLAAIIISQYGGPDGELGASLRYLSQRYSMPFDELKGLLTDIGTEELGHLEMIGTIVHQLTRKLSDSQIREAGFAPYFVDHTVGVYPAAAAGFPWNAASMAVKGDPIADLTEDLAADGTTVQEQRGGKPLKTQDFLLYEFFHATFVKGQPTQITDRTSYFTYQNSISYLWAFRNGRPFFMPKFRKEATLCILLPAKTGPLNG